jgi:aerobic-type carbon monoxide dehydrogenase small subunit (CoxS/CutS family)
MAGALCRCMTYFGIQAAVKRAARTMNGKPATAGNETERQQEVRA